MVKGDGSILLFNPLGENRKDTVDIILSDWDENKGSHATISDADGRIYPAQVNRDGNGAYIATFVPDVKPFRWSRYSIAPLKEGEKPETVGELTAQEWARFREMPQIDVDDLLDVHEFLRDFEGDFASLFEDRTR